jgi:hypothetical protein
MKIVRTACVAATTVAVAVGLTTTAQASPNPDTSVTVSESAQSAALAYWTPARMAAAKVADAPSVTSHAASGAEAVTTGSPVSVPPTAGSLGATSTPQPLAATAVARPYTDLPDRLNGKIFFKEGTSNFVCSGTVVNSGNKDMVDTAGHCVADGQGSHAFFSNWVFVPAYSSSCNGCGDAPYGRWTARLATTTTEWKNFGNFKQDYAYLVLRTNSSGQHIVNALGGQGSTFNQSRTQTWRDYGYPQAAPFNGYNQYLCVSGRLADDNPSSRTGPLTIRISCNMTGGSSGGGWLVRLSGGLGYVNSHNSYKYVSGPLADPSVMYGPYYGSQALSLFNYSAGL